MYTLSKMHVSLKHMKSKTVLTVQNFSTIYTCTREKEKVSFSLNNLLILHTSRVNYARKMLHVTRVYKF